MTALGNAMEAPLRVQGLSREQARERGVEYLEMVGLGDKLDTYPAQLSGGQKQRVGIARALAMCPEIMLFDEVTSALDPELVGGILQILRDLSARRSMTMIIVTHQMKFAERSSDRTLVLRRRQYRRGRGVRHAVQPAQGSPYAAVPGQRDRRAVNGGGAEGGAGMSRVSGGGQGAPCRVRRAQGRTAGFDPVAASGIGPCAARRRYAVRFIARRRLRMSQLFTPPRPVPCDWPTAS